MKTPRLPVETVTQCLECTLPECLQDHPGCAFRTHDETRPSDVRDGCCWACPSGHAILSDNSKAPFYFYCNLREEFVGGYLKLCTYQDRR